MYQWLVFAHVLGVFGFLLAHGTAAAVAFVLPRQREVERVRVLLDLSRGVTMVAVVSLLVLIAAGLTIGFLGNWWGQGWIWTSLGLFTLILLPVPSWSVPTATSAGPQKMPVPTSSLRCAPGLVHANSS